MTDGAVTEVTERKKTIPMGGAMRTKSIILLVLALGCGLIAAIGVTQVISQEDNAPKPVGEMIKILVAKEDIAEGRKITSQLVKIEEWPKERVPVGTITDLEAIDGMRARTDILTDEPLREKKLLGKDDLRTPTDHIDPSMRAVPIKIEKDSNAGLIRPGDRVDVLANIRKNTQEGIPHSRTITLLQNVEIFAVDDVFRVDPANEGGETTIARTVTLILTPKQAEKVDLAQMLGKLRIIMRSPDDVNIVEGDLGIGTNELLGNTEESLPIAKQEPQPTNPVPQPIVIPENETWKMRILTGSAVDDVVLEEREGNEGKKIWQLLREGQEPHTLEPISTPTAGVMPLTPVDSSLIPPGLEPSEE